MAVSAVSGNLSTSNQYIKYRIVVTENSVDVANNTSNVNVRVQVWRTNQGFETYGTGTVYVQIDGVMYSAAISRSQVFTYNSYTQIFNRNVTIAHEDSGAKNLYVAAAINHTQFTSNPQGFTTALTTIARYAAITQTLAGKTETTVSINWTTDSIVDNLWYSVDDGANWENVLIADATSGAYTIEGLNAGTAYSVKTRVRRKSSQLESDSSAQSVTTYDYPYASSMPDFVIGNTLTLGFYNPLARTIDISVIGADNSEKAAGQISGTTASGFDDSAWINWLYASIPNAQSGNYKIKVVYGTIERTNTGGVYSINASDCAPIIGNAAYRDTNQFTINATGNDQRIVQNQSTVEYTASNLTGQQSATIVSCSVAVNGNTYDLTLSGTTATGGGAVIDSATDVQAVFTVTDSRGLTGTKSVTISMLDWTLPSAIITLQRKDNFYSETYITVDADFSYIDGGNQGTITYKARKVGDTAYSITGTLQDNVQAMFVADNSYEWEVVVTLQDIFGVAVTYNAFLSRGIPIIYFDRLRSSVGVNCFPSRDKSFEVDGKTVFEMVYPIGSVYLTTDSTFTPGAEFGGTWNQLTSSISGVAMWERTA